MEFDWDEHNLFHIAQHGVTAEQVETAMRSFPVFIKTEVRNGETRNSYVGRSSDSVILMIIVTDRNHQIRCVTAFRAKQFFRDIYLLKRGPLK